MPKPIICNRLLLQQSLDERLSEEQEEALSRHLSQCAECRQELERLAADAQDWTRISAALRRNGLPSALNEAPVSTRDDEIDPADFAVDFLQPALSPDALGRVGDVEIQEVIGRSGMAIVLKGYQPELKRLVAVKVLAPHLAINGAARKRFAREAQAAAAILHPNVMPILAVDSSGKLPCLVMPYVACESLQQRIDRAGPLELIDILRIGHQTASGLAAAHAQGLVHRDVKPANILLEKGVDRVLLTDFGLARAVDDASLTRTGVIAGTPQFMSPEQARGETIDARSDLFSLGSVLYTMIAGRPPFRAETTYGILRRITDSLPRCLRERAPHTPEWLERIVGTLLAKQPDQRFPSAERVAGILQQCLAHVQQPRAVSLPEACLPRPVAQRRHRWLWGVGVLATVALLGAALVFQRPKHEVHQPSLDHPTQTSIDWDDSARQIEALQNDIDHLHRRASQLWDEPDQGADHELNNLTPNPEPFP